MKKEIIIKRTWYGMLSMWLNYVFIPIRMPCWLLDNWFTLCSDNNSYVYYRSITDQVKGSILENLGKYHSDLVEDLYLVRTFRMSSNKVLTEYTLKKLIEHSLPEAENPMYSSVLTKSTWCLADCGTFKVGTDLSNLVVGCVDGSINEILTRIIQDEEKL